MKNLYSNYDCITNNENKYKFWKISIVLREIYKYMISLDYGINYDNDENGVTWEINNNLNDLISQLYEKLKSLDFTDIIYFEIIQYDDDDFYGVLLFDGDYNIIYRYFWDFDLYVFDNPTGYDFIDNDFNIWEWL